MKSRCRAPVTSRLPPSNSDLHGADDPIADTEPARRGYRRASARLRPIAAARRLPASRSLRDPGLVAAVVRARSHPDASGAARRRRTSSSARSRVTARQACGRDDLLVRRFRPQVDGAVATVDHMRHCHERQLTQSAAASSPAEIGRDRPSERRSRSASQTGASVDRAGDSLGDGLAAGAPEPPRSQGRGHDRQARRYRGRPPRRERAPVAGAAACGSGPWTRRRDPERPAEVLDERAAVGIAIVGCLGQAAAR